MKNTFGNTLTVTLFGESHGAQIGAVVDGLAPGMRVDLEAIKKQLTLRRPTLGLSTARVEPDDLSIVSGVYRGKTTGTPLCLLISNRDTDDKPYEDVRALARPGHADYTAFLKYHGNEDPRGGGHFSGRITAALVAVGAILTTALNARGIWIGTHIARLAAIDDMPLLASREQIARLCDKPFATVDDARAALMQDAIRAAAAEGDSVGGILETVVVGMPRGLGEPWFDSVESMLSHALFSIPAVKGVAFGDGFALADMRGSEANDPFRIENGEVVTTSNRNGGINGGISNGMPLRFSVAVKPTPSIARRQQTVDFLKGENAEIDVRGRHDPTIVHRARAVVDALTAIVLSDLLTMRYGTDALTGV